MDADLDHGRTDPLPEGHAKSRREVFPMSRLKVAEPGADGKRRVEGYASVFGVRDSYGDIVVKGAFERSLRERPDVRVLWQHDSTRPIGRQEQAYENDYGLVVRGVLSDTDFVTGEVMPLLEDGVVNGLSIGYDFVKGQSAEEGYLLLDLELHEWSPVTFPACEPAQITHVKALDAAPTTRHADNIQHAAKKLGHELEWLAHDSVRRDGLDFTQLVDLEAKLRGTLAGSSPVAAHADGGDEVELAYLAGLRDGLDLKE